MNKIEVQLKAKSKHLFSCAISVVDSQGNKYEYKEEKVVDQPLGVTYIIKMSEDELEGKFIKITVCGIATDNDKKDYSLYISIINSGQILWEETITGKEGNLQGVKFLYSQKK